MNGPLNDPMDGRGGVSEAVAALRQTSFLRVMLVLAATVIVLAGIRLGAPILNPIFFALVLSLSGPTRFSFGSEKRPWARPVQPDSDLLASGRRCPPTI